MYGTQASNTSPLSLLPFENDVKMYGTQAYVWRCYENMRFENDVKMYGTQANHIVVH